ncbi:DUF169 domain-containing protein [Fundidesulfovibrio putealis]|uniref:DUF169 domain-containing protein n=1 Tax=Fundidesulfovibrio putealis TaxID=270496 RepID=UPI00041C40DA|nr:DUF169 domain-containing protein [Fundidesulfovibrio putealis]
MTSVTPDFMREALMRELRLMHAPVAVFYCFNQEGVDAFKAGGDYHRPVKPVTFCQAELGPRMESIRVLMEPEKLGCTNAKYVFGWKGCDEGELKSHAKYASGALTLEAIVKGKATLQGKGLMAVGLEPLGASDRMPDVVHFTCDTMQAYHLATDWMATQGRPVLESAITVNSAACGGNVRVFETTKANVYLACSGNYNAGKMERGEVNISIPGDQLPAVVERLLERKAKTGGASITRLGDPFPGADICKNCPLIVFKRD